MSALTLTTVLRGLRPSPIVAAVFCSALIVGPVQSSGAPTPAFAQGPQTCLQKFGVAEPLPNDDGIREIDSEDQLVWLTDSDTPGDARFSSHFVLEDDLDLDGCIWTPIFQPGQDERPEARGQPAQEAITAGFTGIFDGNNHTISGLRLSSPDRVVDDSDELEAILLGFFALINPPGVVQNISFASPVIVLNNQSYANEGSFQDGIGVVAGAVGRVESPASTSSFRNVTVDDGSAALECTDQNGCVLQAVGGLAGDLNHAEVTNITIDVSIAFLDRSPEEVVPGELDRRVTLPPAGSRLASVGLLSGKAADTSASDISVTGAIRSEVSTNGVAGISGVWFDSSLSQGQSDVAIEVGGGAENIAPRGLSVRNMGGAFGSLFDSTVTTTFAAGSIDLLLAADPDDQTEVEVLGGLVGRASNASLSDILVATETTIVIVNPDEHDTVSVSGVAGVLGVAGDRQETGARAPQVTRSLAIGSLSLAGIPAPTTPEGVGAFVGKVVSDKDPRVTDSYWAATGYPSTTPFGAAKTDEELRELDTYTGWSILPAWAQAETTWGICQQPEPSLPFLQWMTASDPCLAEESSATAGSATRQSVTRVEVFSVGPVQITFDARVGDVVAGTTSSAWGDSMLPNSSLRKEVRSTPTLIFQTTVSPDGNFLIAGVLPAMTPGSHTLLTSGVDSAGTPWVVSVPFRVDSSGRFSWIGEPTFSTGALLAATGPAVSASLVLLAGLLTALTGGALVYARRYKTGDAKAAG